MASFFLKLRQRFFKSSVLVFFALILAAGVIYTVPSVKSIVNILKGPVLEQPTPIHIQGQFQGRKGPFILVAESVSLYPVADSSAKPLGRAAPSQRGRVIARQGEWAFIMTENGETPLGWVKNSQLAYPSQFQKSRWEYGTTDYTKDMFSGRIYPKPNGRFMTSWEASGNGLLLNGKYYGDVMEYGDLIWLKKESPDLFFDFLIIDAKSEQILSELKYQN